MGNLLRFFGIFIKKRDTENSKTDIVAILKRVPLFSTLNKKELKKVSLVVYERIFENDEYLFREGNPSACLFIIKDGVVVIERTNEDGDTLQLATFKEADFFGELTLLDDTPRSASARCVKRTVVLAFFRQDLISLIERDTAIGVKIMFELSKMLASRLVETNKLSHKYKRLALNYKKMLEKRDEDKREE